MEKFPLVALKQPSLKQAQQELDAIRKSGNSLPVVVYAGDLNATELISLIQDFHPLIFSHTLDLNHLEKLRFKKQTLAQIFQQCVLDLSQVTSIAMLESALTRRLAQPLNINCVRLQFYPHSNAFRQQLQKSKFEFHEANIKDDESQPPILFFVRNNQKKFRTDEINLLNQLAEMSTLNLKMIRKLEKLETLREQWEATFNSFDEAICLTTKDYVLVKTNQKFQTLFEKSNSELIHLNLLEFFPEAGAINPSLSREVYIKIGNKSRWLEIRHHSTESHNIYMFKDISVEKQMEQKIFESSKMAELGMISSSIAHELNNPIGGILTYLQLMKMSLAKTHSIFPDLNDMEVATIKCKSIVENLLNFARKPDLNEDSQSIDPAEALKKVVQIIKP